VSEVSPPPAPEEAYALIASEEPGNVETGLAWLREYAGAHPDAADAWYQLGSGLDRADHEAEAMDAYDRVFALGIDRLDPAVRPHLMLQAGSTLRNLGRLDESRAMLEEGVRCYPEMRALQVFLALTEASAGRERAAIDHLLATVLQDGTDDHSVHDFRRAIAWYAEHLWDDVLAAKPENND
jgi:tetratricopeptide (TPR) repeat protein